MIVVVTPVINHLIANGIDANFVGVKSGECKSEYVVVKQMDTTSQLGSRDLGSTIIDVIFYIPLSKPLQIEAYAQKVIEELKKLDYLKSVGHFTPVITDDERKAYTFSIMYQIYKRMEG